MTNENLSISSREKDVAELLMLGCSNKEIGKKLAIEPTTVKVHVHNLLQKTRSENRTDLVINLIFNSERFDVEEIVQRVSAIKTAPKEDDW